MAYLSDKLTEAELRKLERKISAEYANAFLEMKKKSEHYFADFESEVAEKMAQVEAGDLSQSVFTNWYQTKIMRNEAMQDMLLSFADRMVKADKVAASYINDATPGIFSLNANYEGYRISQAHDGISWSIYNEETVRKLFLQDEIQLPKRTINTAVDKAWNLKKLNGALISGIVQGKSPKHLAESFDQVQGMGRSAAMRAARTAFTGAQNAGRVDSYNRAEAMGIEVLKEWMCSLDSRTRDSHRDLDGERRKPDEKFSNGLMYPGDPDGAPEEVYNCRCTLLPFLPGISDDGDRITYSKWLEEQELYDPFFNTGFNREYKNVSKEFREIAKEDNIYMQFGMVDYMMDEYLPGTKANYSDVVLDKISSRGRYNVETKIVKIRKSLNGIDRVKTMIHENIHARYESEKLRTFSERNITECATECLTRIICEKNNYYGYARSYETIMDAWDDIMDLINVDQKTVALSILRANVEDRMAAFKTMIDVGIRYSGADRETVNDLIEVIYNYAKK